MILNWMLASTLFALVLAGAAMVGERAALAVGKPRRGVWAFALAAASLWPLAAGAWTLLAPAPAAIARITTRISSGAPAALTVQLPIGESLGATLDHLLVLLWIAASVAIGARIIVALRRMRAVTRAAVPMILDGTPVLVSDSAGPAVSGFWRPQIIVPRWLLDFDAPLRSVVLRHEHEHVAQGDAGVMLAAALATAAAPWNPAVWWMSRRLRLAVELDCDARVLAAREEPERYGRLLMLVAQRQAHARLAPMLAESNADLEWRIGTMQAPHARPSLVRAITLGAAAAALALLAFTSPAMAGVRAPEALVRAKPATPAVRALPAVTTTSSTQQVQAKAPPPPPKQAAKPGQGAVPLKVRDTVERKQADRPFVEFTLSSQAREAEHTQRPRYPDILRTAGVEGVVVVQFVVNEDGSADTTSLKVLRATHALFQAAVRTALPNMRYTPAMVKGRAVRQLIEQTFEFNIADASPGVEAIRADTIAPSPVHRLTKVVITAARPPQ